MVNLTNLFICVKFMNGGKMILLIIIIAAIVLAFILIYNSLVVKRTRVDNGWAQIDVQLKRRYDLIPNLVETVKGYAAHEKEVLVKVTELRSRAMGASSPKEAAETNNMLTATLKTLFAVAENYPQLKANENFMKLQEELTATENKIAFARQFYNDVVMDYNATIQKVPQTIIASMFGFTAREFFEAPAEDKEPVRVKF
jgi:LemA protein